jgi:Leucine-rich repeat (LRR) protein
MQINKKTIILVLIVFWVFNAVKNSVTISFKKNNIISGSGDTVVTDNKFPTSQKKNSLDLSGQGLDKLPAYVLSRTNLEELNISNNLITGALPSEIGKLTKLKVLNASNNMMTGVPAEIGYLPNLEVLDLSNNKLTGLPNELAQLKKLRILNLSGNAYSTHDLDITRVGLSPDVTIIL